MTPLTSQEVHLFQWTSAEAWSSGILARFQDGIKLLIPQDQMPLVSFEIIDTGRINSISNTDAASQPTDTSLSGSKPPATSFSAGKDWRGEDTSEVQSSPFDEQGLLALLGLSFATIGGLPVGGEGVATAFNNPSTFSAGQGLVFLSASSNRLFWPTAAALDASGASSLAWNAMNRTIGNSALEPGQFSSHNHSISTTGSKSSVDSNSLSYIMNGLYPSFGHQDFTEEPGFLVDSDPTSHIMSGLYPSFGHQYFTEEPESTVISNPTSSVSSGYVSDNLSQADQSVSHDNLFYPTLSPTVAPIQEIELPSYPNGSCHLCQYLPVACDSCIRYGIEARHLPPIPIDRLPRRRLSDAGNDRTPLTESEELSIVYLRHRHNMSYGKMESKGFSRGAAHRLLHREDIQAWLGSIQPHYTQQ
ncbi:MAG: hypothetical protein J3Q66DRAFT_406505 [Benniella sp.]|nr:MAG: hypothetical protein J3Q66DRAFT_406505 [Benniella sp.]